MTNWVIPCSLKAYDVINAFRTLKKIDWKQSTNVEVGAYVYIYVGAPISAIKFKCRAIEVNKTESATDDSEFVIDDEPYGGKCMCLELVEEYRDDLYPKDVVMANGLRTIQGPSKVTETLERFLSRDFNPHTNIHYLQVLEYLENNRGIPYSNPDASGIAADEKNRLIEVKKKGQEAVAELKKMAALCSERFGLDKCEPLSWLDGSNTKTRNYLWAQMKFNSYAARNESISIFVEMAPNQEKARYRISLVIRYDKSDEEAMAAYHRFFELPLDTKHQLIYVLDEDGRLSELTEPQEQVKKKYEDGTYKRVQICRILEKTPDAANETFEQGLLEAVAALMPYYEYVLGKNASAAASVDEEYWPSISEYDPGIDAAAFDRNMILYGPPGTGKTYYTAIYAVAIADNRPFKEVESEAKTDYKKVLGRYNELKKEERIAFTTFHQSYGYEEFIEGIKPIVDESKEDIGYTIEDGVFKSFCKAAEVPKSGDIDHTANVWKVTLKKPGDSDLKKECFADGTIKYNFKRLEECAGTLEYSFVSQFVDKMKIGDIVVSYSGSATDIDGVAIVTGDAEYDESKSGFRWKRTVKWIYQGKPVNIKELNGNKYLSGDPIYCLKRVKIGELLKLVEPQSYKANDKNYVFIIDEINRGNISKIFGELITLIEETKRKGAAEEMSAILPYSAEPFSVPNNVYILGTMNTADRSIALIDTALRRRFQFVEMMPDPQILYDMGANVVTDNGQTLDVAKMLEIINKRIEYLYDRDHTIGHAFFAKLKDDPTVERLGNIFQKSVLPLLQEYFYEDYEKIQLVLGDNDKDEKLKFVKDSPIEDDIFNRYVSDITGLAETKYEIQTSAFTNLESYKKIHKSL